MKVDPAQYNSKGERASVCFGNTATLLKGERVRAAGENICFPVFFRLNFHELDSEKTQNATSCLCFHSLVFILFCFNDTEWIFAGVLNYLGSCIYHVSLQLRCYHGQAR